MNVFLRIGEILTITSAGKVRQLPNSEVDKDGTARRFSRVAVPASAARAATGGNLCLLLLAGGAGAPAIGAARRRLWSVDPFCRAGEFRRSVCRPVLPRL